MHTCIYMYACMRVSKYAYMHVCMYACTRETLDSDSKTAGQLSVTGTFEQ